MSKNRIISFFALVLAAMLLLAAAMPAQAFAVTQEEVSAVRARRDELSAQREAAQAVVDELESQQAGVLERKQAMDERNMYTLEQMQLNKEEIALYDDMIAEKAEEVAAAKTLEEQQLARYRIRVRAMEENGVYSVLTMVLNSSSLGEFLTVLDDMGQIMASDRELEEAYIAARENTEQVKAEYEEFRAELQEKQDELRAEQEQLQAEIDEATALIRDLQENIDTRREEYEEILAIEEEADRELEALMAELERQRQEELRRQREAEEAAARAAAEAAKAAQQALQAQQQQAQQNQQSQSTPAPVAPKVTGTGSFTWPVPSCTYITSRFGLRIHPVYGTEKYHSGLDVGAGYGAAIVAADSGTVIRAGNSGDGYGNCVIIDHGNGYQTLYGHMSSVTVSEGQTVTKGDTIGYVGSTGLSTGPHCHFEVWSGGSRTDPEQFFSGLTFSAEAGE